MASNSLPSHICISNIYIYSGVSQNKVCGTGSLSQGYVSRVCFVVCFKGLFRGVFRTGLSSLNQNMPLICFNYSSACFYFHEFV